MFRSDSLSLNQEKIIGTQVKMLQIHNMGQDSKKSETFLKHGAGFKTFSISLCKLLGEPVQFSPSWPWKVDYGGRIKQKSRNNLGLSKGI